MQREQSQQSEADAGGRKQARKTIGQLYLVGVPIGHPDDITIRALRVLIQTDIIATEDSRATEALLRHHKLSTPITSYGPMKIKEKVAILIDRMQQGSSVALVSDCGSPVISDPGSLLVATAYRHHISVYSIPGPSVVTAAIAASGFSAEAFHFYGDITTENGSPMRRLTHILTYAEPTILFCPAQSCLAMLEAIAKTDPRRQIALACNLTLPKETMLRGTARHVSEILKRIQTPEAVTMIVGGKKSARAQQKSRGKT